MITNALRFGRWRLLLIASLVSLVAALPVARADFDNLDTEQSHAQQEGDETPSAWKKDWAVEEGFSLSIDTQGYHYPTAIAFVPRPGPAPKDPLYFVTELRGKIKVVTNDRTVHTFAEGFLQTEFYEEPPKRDAEFGLAGICLEPSHGYVFVTFAYQDGKTLRNNVIRFDTTPETFALKPKSQQAFTEVFKGYESGPSHQIGGCQVSGDTLFVGVGDGYNSALGSQRLDTFQGKMIRMTLDGQPVADNPFRVDNDSHRAANYIWAYGLRNPFSLRIVNSNVMVADNGLNIDRFIRLHKGRNYLWDGNDNSMAANADYVFAGAIGPTQMDYFRQTSPAFPDQFKNQFYVALSVTEKPAGIMRIPYDLENATMAGVPEFLLMSKEGVQQPLTGLAFGPDGLYFTPILPVIDGQGAVLKIKYEPKNAHPFTVADLEAFNLASADDRLVMRFIASKGCLGCHQVQGAPRGGTKGPPLGGEAMIERIQQRIDSPEYLAFLKSLDMQDDELLNRYKEARREVIEAQGLERVRLWTKYQILEPRFDGLLSGMPGMGLSKGEAEVVARFLVGETSQGFIPMLTDKLIGTEHRQHVSLALGAGILIGLPIGFVFLLVARFRRTRRSG